MTVRLAILVGILAVAVAAAGATEIELKNGVPLEGRIVGEDFIHLTIEIPFPGPVRGFGKRKVAWSDILSIDGLSIADWKRREAARPAVVESERTGDAPAERPFTLEPRRWLGDYSAWIQEGEGFGMAFRLGALALLVLVPGLLVLLGGRWLGIEHLDGFRAFGGALVGLGVGAALYRAWPGWVGEWPLGAMAGVTAAVLLVVRPPLLRGLVIVGLQLVGLAAAVLGTLAGSGSLS